MGYALAEAALAHGWEVVLVSGPVEIPVPHGCEIHAVTTTEEMKVACLKLFPECNGVIATAAVCDYKPRERVAGKLSKTGGPITIEMIETDDVLAELGRLKGGRFVMGFALEAQNPHENALQKLRRKQCDWIVLNGPSAIGSETNSVELIAADGTTAARWAGSKREVAEELVRWVAGMRS
jgi:phosphopantothenoylcysteine decarboxylase/phosphopantothenate--cysteine ligase